MYEALKSRLYQNGDESTIYDTFKNIYLIDIGIKRVNGFKGLDSHIQSKHII